MNIINKIINGPYLLAPGLEKITISWEMAQLTKLQLKYQQANTTTIISINPEFIHEPACRKYPDGCFLYTAVLKKLLPGKLYYYKIFTEDNILLSSGHFKTLPQKTEKISIITISDSHLFNTEKQFSQMVSTKQPDFIIHSGDISFGTGYQHEQYVQNWFQKIPDILRTTPFYYIPGNHDEGPFYNIFFAQPQAKTVNGIYNGHSYSFDYGSVHFAMVDSNSWGLFEMNAVNSGLNPDNTTKKCITKTLQWLRNDLEQKNSRHASWRILILHHPYTDEFNNKYIIPIAEKYNVDLVISGHLHYYVKAISINPAIGTKTTYISQGSLQDPNASLNKSGEKRFLGDFPEITAMGKNNYGQLEISKDLICYKFFGFYKNTDKLIDTVILSHEPPKIELNNVQINRLDNNGHIEITASAINKSNIPSAVNINLFDNDKKHTINLFGSKNNSHVVVLDPFEEKKLTALYKAVYQGEHIITIGNTNKKIVVFEPTQLSFSHMKLFTGKQLSSNYLSASIEAVNNLDREIFTAIPLYINQHIAVTKNLFFRGHEQKNIDFAYKFSQCGNYQISIADQLPKEISIEGGIRVIPRIHDKSGHGHYGLLHGTPKIISKKDCVEIYLEQYGDYIEIPSTPDMETDTCFTGIVNAKIERLAKENEMSHNPLMVKGKSVGWGATYLLRMVVERSGSLKWGICHDSTEYSWQGGNANIGKWTQYAITFDKKTGGNSYCNTENTAHVTGISSECQLRQWKKEPIFIGYSYIGHIIKEIDRPKYFTHLPGHINQVRFYKTNLSESEIQSVYNSPYKDGPKKKDLIVWLDFHNILTVGTHITEWRHPAVYDPEYKTEKKYWSFKQLKTKASIPLPTDIKSTIEVSDDCLFIKGSMEIILKTGTNYTDISNLPPAQYIRIITNFSAQIGPEGTFTPELQEYQITAANENNFTEIFWSTRKDWEKGTFNGAIGFAPVDRLRNFTEYTDIIHG
ncbi:metallophosphoesterase [Pectinatus sottacetonis]|uniref:metallophosphoesterase n=1 Tax=Pectinatus sottacetonis TaxID=1002795 RepID=UPI0018C5E25E|nr:metallophosphoesterase [Pectinatus sottacetonis]